MIHRSIAPIILLGSTLLQNSCSSIPTQFGGTSPIPVERRSSAAIDLARPAVKKTDGGYSIVGYLVRQFGAPTTAHSHVDVQFLAADGAVLREESVAFQPRELPPRARLAAPSARYELSEANPPPGTARIRVVADDQPHSRP